MPLLGEIWVPSADRVKSGLGRRWAVISCALSSSIFNSPANRVELCCSNSCRTCSQVKGVWICAGHTPHSIKTQPSHRVLCIHDSVLAPHFCTPPKGKEYHGLFWLRDLRATLRFLERF